VTAVALLLDAPEAGAAKPRLAAELGPAPAARLYRLLATRALTAARAAGCDPVVWFRPPSARSEMQQWLGAGVELRPQASGSLGARIGAAVAGVSLPSGWIALVRDCAGIDGALITAAVETLADLPMVLGPTSDGGVYLVGGRVPVPSALRGLADAGPGALAALRGGLAKEGLGWSETPVLAAIECAADARAARLLT
jgi:glycosyltransferase A (GT-A) superfamily protein (DUF2064 family)